MIQTKNETPLLEKATLFFMAIYIFMSYNACDLWISSKWLPMSLYAFLGVGALCGFSKLLKNVKTKIPAPFLWYGSFMVLSVIIMLYSNEKSIMSGTYYLMLVTAILSTFIYIVVTDRKWFSVLCWIYSISGAFLVLMLQLTENLVGKDSDRLGEDLMGNANIFAGMMMVSAMFTIWLLIFGRQSKLAKFLLVVSLLADMYALALSAGRKYFVIPFLFLYLLLLFQTDEKGRRHFIRNTIFVGALVLLVYYLIMNVPIFYDSIGIRMERLLNGFFGEGDQGASAEIRERMRELALLEWGKSPIWGYGFDSFKYIAEKELSFFTYSHCNYTELLYNGGVLYFLVYYFFYFVLLKKALIEKKGSTPFRAFTVSVVLSLLVFEYGSVTYESSYVVILLFMAYAGLKFGEKEKEEVCDGKNKNSTEASA